MDGGFGIRQTLLPISAADLKTRSVDLRKEK